MNTIDHSNGRLHILDGRLFYSPNSTRTVRIPPHHDPMRNVFQFRHVCYDNFVEPRWWREDSGWVGFVMKKPYLEGYPFDRLNRMPRPVRHQSGFQLDPNVRDSWRRLEYKLEWATSLLAKEFHTSTARPFLPSQFGYSGVWKSEIPLQIYLNLSRDWFSLWWGLLSYLVARISFNDEMGPTSFGVPRWYAHLTELGIDETWLRSVQASPVCTFDHNFHPVGAFVDLRTRVRLQPPIQWLISIGMPVWYPVHLSDVWDADRTPQADFVGLLPPPEMFHRWLSPEVYRIPGNVQVQTEQYIYVMRAKSNHFPTAATSAPATLPLPPSSSAPHTLQPPQLQPPQRPTRKYVSWKEFLEKRALRNAELEASETPAARQTRLQRQKQRPTRKTKMFEWTTGQDPEDERLYRTLVTKGRHDDMLESYSSKQYLYDAFHNEWDFCTEFGGDDDDSDDDDDSEHKDGDATCNTHNKLLQRLASPPPDQEPLGSFERTSSPVPPLQDQEVWDEPQSATSGLVHSLYYRFGFVSPLEPLQSGGRSINRNDKEWRDAIRIAGLKADTDRLPTPSTDHLVVDFLKCLRTSSRPDANLWDLESSNRNPVTASPWFSRIRVLLPSLFYFAFPESDPRTHSTITLNTPVDVLQVCRQLQPNLSQYELGRYLIERGIPFHTLVWGNRRMPNAPMSPIANGLDTRSAKHVFTSQDYYTYEQRRRAFFKSPRARACLLRGGILWRLAKDFLSFDDALNGPSDTALYDHQEFSRVDPSHPAKAWRDDGLTLEDIHLVCGSYAYWTANGSQQATVSWWPPQYVWEAQSAVENYGYWTEYNESWFQKRLGEIVSGKAGPITQDGWRDKLRGLRTAKPVREAYKSFAAACVPRS